MALSKRLRDALANLYAEGFEPGPEALVLPGIEQNNFRHREWRRITEQAKVGGVRLKDLRDTFASQLLTCGIQLGWVSQQLGHAHVATTARYYAKWCGGDVYLAPLSSNPRHRIHPNLTP